MDSYRDGAWENDASCKGADTERFFRDLSPIDAMTKKMCALCLVKTQCLEAALSEERAAKQRYGYRGGKTPHQRKMIYINRQRAARIARKLAERSNRRPDSESTYR